MPVCQIRTHNRHLNIIALLKFELTERDGSLHRVALTLVMIDSH